MSNKMKVKVVSVGETETFGANNFRKRELIGEVTDGQYTNPFCFEFVQDKVDLLDTILPDTFVEVSFNIRCKKWEQEGKPNQYFTSLQGWKIEA